MRGEEDGSVFRARLDLSKKIESLSKVGPDSFVRVLKAVEKEIKIFGKVVLSSSEFLAIMFLFNSRTHAEVVSGAFRILQGVEMTEEQVSLLFDWKRTEQSGGESYWHVNWTFLDKEIGTKQKTVKFMVEISEKYPAFVWDALHTLFLLLDDENVRVRAKSYAGLVKISKGWWKRWGPAEKKTYRKNMEYFGCNSVEIVRKESKRLEKKQKEAKIQITAISKNFIRVHVRLGREIRGESTRIEVKGAALETLRGQRKHTFLYCRATPSVVCTVYHTETPVATREALFEETEKG